MLDLSASSCLKEGTLAFVSFSTIRTNADAFFYCVTTLYAQRELFFFFQFLVTMIVITNLIRIEEIFADS